MVLDRAALAREVTRRRTFAIISHPDAGKTTLTEKLLLYSGAIELAGAVRGRKSRRHATSDWMEMEQQRGISISTAALAAIEEAGLADQISIGSFDLSPTMLEAIDQGRALFGIDAQQYLTGYYPVIFLAIYAKYGMIPTNDVLTGPLFVMQDTAGRVIELSKQGYR